MLFRKIYTRAVYLNKSVLKEKIAGTRRTEGKIKPVETRDYDRKKKILNYEW